jgi:nucleoside-diphosphate-sugar epimerase
MKILITGGNGMVGRHLTKLLQKEGHEVGWLVRNSGNETGVRYFLWNVERGELDKNSIEWGFNIIQKAVADASSE